MEANSEVIVYMFQCQGDFSLCGMWNELWLQTESVYRSLSQPGTALHNITSEISPSEKEIMRVLMISFQFLHARDARIQTLRIFCGL